MAAARLVAALVASVMAKLPFPRSRRFVAAMLEPGFMRIPPDESRVSRSGLSAGPPLALRSSPAPVPMVSSPPVIRVTLSKGDRTPAMPPAVPRSATIALTR